MNSIFRYILSAVLILGILTIVNLKGRTGQDISEKGEEKVSDKFEKATLGAGCFWCVEAIFQDLEGVQSVVSGYSGGDVDNPTYEEVCKGNTGHAEVIQILFDPGIIDFEEILYVFWQIHDPTTLNRQGADVGTQYRSAVFYHSEEQKVIAEGLKKKIEDEKLWPDPVVTEIVPFGKFYKAENYHQNYFVQNPNQPYCQFVINPKISKFRKKFKDRLKK